jgi:hypothetical protein
MRSRSAEVESLRAEAAYQKEEEGKKEEEEYIDKYK